MRFLSREGRDTHVIKLSWVLLSVGTSLILVNRVYPALLGSLLSSLRVIPEALILIGISLLFCSVLRQRLVEARKDPYRHIEK